MEHVDVKSEVYVLLKVCQVWHGATVWVNWCPYQPNVDGAARLCNLCTWSSCKIPEGSDRKSCGWKPKMLRLQRRTLNLDFQNPKHPQHCACCMRWSTKVLESSRFFNVFHESSWIIMKLHCPSFASETEGHHSCEALSHLRQQVFQPHGQHCAGLHGHSCWLEQLQYLTSCLHIHVEHIGSTSNIWMWRKYATKKHGVLENNCKYNSNNIHIYIYMIILQ